MIFLISQKIIMQYDVCGGVIYISIKSKYLKTENPLKDWQESGLNYGNLEGTQRLHNNKQTNNQVDKQTNKQADRQKDWLTD